MKGLPFNAEMALAVLERRKSVTRRPMKDQPFFDAQYFGYNPFTQEHMIGEEHFKQGFKAPYYPGEVVYMQEPWGVEPGRYIQPSIPHGYGGRFEDEVFYKADDPNLPGMLWRSPVTMPQWASRLHLRLTVRPERLQDVTEEEAKLEGVKLLSHDGRMIYTKDYKTAFRVLWDSIYGKKYPWSSNPYIWRYGLEEVWRR